MITIYISQGSVAGNRNQFSYFKQKNIKHKELCAYKMLEFWEDRELDWASRETPRIMFQNHSDKEIENFTKIGGWGIKTLSPEL